MMEFVVFSCMRPAGLCGSHDIRWFLSVERLEASGDAFLVQSLMIR
jgi:hypothetical protein